MREEPKGPEQPQRVVVGHQYDVRATPSPTMSVLVTGPGLPRPMRLPFPDTSYREDRSRRWAVRVRESEPPGYVVAITERLLPDTQIQRPWEIAAVVHVHPMASMLLQANIRGPVLVPNEDHADMERRVREYVRQELCKEHHGSTLGEPLLLSGAPEKVADFVDEESSPEPKTLLVVEHFDGSTTLFELGEQDSWENASGGMILNVGAGEETTYLPWQSVKLYRFVKGGRPPVAPGA